MPGASKDGGKAQQAARQTQDSELERWVGSVIPLNIGDEEKRPKLECPRAALV